MSASAAIPQRGASITHRKEAAREGGKGQTRESLLLRASSVCLNLGVLPPACLVDFLSLGKMQPAGSVACLPVAEPCLPV